MFADYQLDGFFDEMMAPDGRTRLAYQKLVEQVEALGMDELCLRQQAAEQTFRSLGITFNVYNEGMGMEKIFPFDMFPRLIDGNEWTKMEKGLTQRILALNHFISDIYTEKRIIKEGIIPAHVLESSEGYRKECEGLTPPNGTWCHISGIDLIKNDDGIFHVLEDNLRVPSGVSYVLGNREVMKRSMPRAFQDLKVRPVYNYHLKLLDMLKTLSTYDNPTVAVLTPGVYNSAYFEHSFLAQQMGVMLVEGRDLTVIDNKLFAKTTEGHKRVHVIYRRIDDDFMDPEVFNPNSQLGVPGLMRAFQAGELAIANAPGTGVADDKVIYTYVPEMIKFYLSEEPIVPNVPTFLCDRPADMDHVLQNLDKLVVKEANGAGGYGMLMGHQASKQERDDYAEKIKADPRNYIAQPILSLSRVPTLCDQVFEGRHVDLRPFLLCSGEDVFVLPGGLTRVALKKDSLVVNSSQGGGSKDTWIVDAHLDEGASQS